MNYIYATSEATSTLVENIKPIMDSITNAVSVGDVVAVVGAGLGFALGFTLMWFGIRKVGGMALGAVKSGKIRI